MRPKGFIIDVPVTISIAVRGASEEESKRIARDFADTLNPSDNYIDGYNEGAIKAGIFGSGVSITEVSLESPTDESCEVLDELEEESDEEAPASDPETASRAPEAPARAGK